VKGDDLEREGTKNSQCHYASVGERSLRGTTALLLEIPKQRCKLFLFCCSKKKKKKFLFLFFIFSFTNL
jgi:hypothetical protein